MKRLDPRVLTALIGIPLVLGIVVRGGPLFWLVAAALAVISLRELDSALQRSKTLQGARLVGVLAYPALVLWLWYAGGAASWLPQFALVTALLCLAVTVYGRGGKVSLISVAITLLATFYVGLFAFMPLLRNHPKDGAALFWTTILCVWASDTAAYYAGRAFGKHPFTPLSPGKTREGAIGGLIAAVLTGALVAGISHMNFGQGLTIGLVVAVAAPLGDLAESFWKRELGIKDLGTLLPGHGGVLDRCDSLLFACFAVYLYVSRA